MLLYTLQAIDSFVKLIQVLGGFSRYDIINTKTTKDAFLLILSCGRILSLGSPALYYAGTDRLQIVGVGSLHVEIPLVVRCFVRLILFLFIKRRSRPKKEEQRSSNAIES